MICKPCRTKDHDHCVDIHLMGTGRNGCSCQHRSGAFTTSTLNPDGTKTEGVYGATGARGSALTIEPELLTDVEVDPIAAIQAVYRRVVANDSYNESALADKHWGGAIASAMPTFNLSPLFPEELA